jgi:Fe-S cluster assembly iron-binding protein IscA
MALDESKENDEIFDDRGITYVIDKVLLEQVKPVKVDYVESPFGSGFSIGSSMKAGGGCGSSCSC